MNKQPPIGIIICGVLIFIASFLSWGTFRLTPLPGGAPPELTALMNQMQTTLSINGWQGHLTLFELQMPNWMIVVCGVAVMVLAVLRCAEIWDVPRGLLVVMSLLGVAHTGIFSFIMLTKATVGVGSLLTFGCFLGLSIQTVMLSEHSRPVVVRSPSLEYSPVNDPVPSRPSGPNPLGSMPSPTGGTVGQADEEPAGVPGDPFYEWRRKRDSE